jgi:hypothetical protein
VAKLHKLCIPFCSLASTILSSDDDILSVSYNQLQQIPPGALSLSHTAEWQLPMVKLHELPQPPPAHLLAAHHHTAPLQADINAAPRMASPEQYLSTDFYDDDFLWDFTDTQPMLQWLDSDFSALEDTWGIDWNVFPPG